MPTTDTRENRQILARSLRRPRDFVALRGVLPRRETFEFDARSGVEVGYFMTADGKVQVVVSEDLCYRGADRAVARVFAAQAAEGWRPVGSPQTADVAGLLAYTDAVLGLNGDEPTTARRAPATAAPAVVVQSVPRPRGKSASADEGKFGRDLVQAARDGTLDPVIGRDKVVDALCRVLSKKTKHAAVLAGEPGVGKTAVVEALAQRIARDPVPESLRGARLLDVNLALLSAGAMHRNEFEGRFKELLDLARADAKTILFLDEIHVLCAPGNDVSQMCKADLGRGRIRCIGATTHAEVRALERDQALMRRFQVVPVEEPSRDDAIAILRTRRDAIAEHHGLRVEDALLDPVVDLSVRFAPGRRLPDKAIDLLDEAAAYEAFAAAKQSGAVGPRPLTMDSVYDVLSTWTTMPVEHLRAAQDTESALERLPTALATRVLGQRPAIDRTVRALRRTFLLRDGGEERRPRASLLFVGPSGVGKTQTALALAEALYGDGRKHVVRIDMADYREEFSLSRLVGSPPGYVGYGRGGELTNRIRETPHGVLLLDEIDKAHERIVAEALLPLVGEGIVHDMASGDVVDARNHVIVLTANSRCLGPSGAALFRTTYGEASEETDDEVRRLVEQRFRAELLGRLDDVVSFRALDAAVIAELWDREVGVLTAALARRSPGVRVEFSATARDQLLAVATGEAATTGARGMRRVFREHVEGPCMDVLSRASDGPGPWTIHIDAAEHGQLQVTRRAA